MNRRAQFAHFLTHKLGEFRYSLSGLTDACNESLCAFNAKLEQKEGNAKSVMYSFSNLTAQVQTIKDILPVLLGLKISWKDLNEIRHMSFIKGARNAITHDGNPIINLWTDGKYYVASEFLRVDDNKKPVMVTPPNEDIRELSLQFGHDLGVALIQLVEPVKADSELSLPIYGQEFFDSAILHHSIPQFAKDLYSETDKREFDANDALRIDKLLADLNSLVSFCDLELAKQ